jgi:hypothetical protein
MDRIIASEVMGHPVTQQKREVFEATAKGTRPVHPYSTDIAAAWEVVERMGITLIPVADGSWFAFVGPNGRWNTPADFIRFLQNENFTQAGAAVGEDAAFTICQAALKAVQNRAAASQSLGAESAGSPPH